MTTPQYSMVIVWSEEDGAYLVHLPDFDFQKFHTHGETYGEAAAKGQEVIESLIGWYQEEGKPLPSPTRSVALEVAA
ncbi:MAG: type II toxin-antitoxin system HicB family antitoxin [Tildeniella torsiva UHER 1998/13D]|jgi:predicted RNase H-like HicB family nuclease|nr:type II toxin-antitoxin system HicB family antitoxin [Tildeniella torsiva UHER 1998/13D]